ncbi:hypothetical protein OJ252_1357 [Cryptosporidium canis]|uniref:Signal peptide-containing protein n=1 Tax=Cryptosporidium canis TaxID=195482 RepID=A0ABQ8P928_9CRYT|nr:hypothetical protein OJ252_1357 [Cryptosporidium canis]
MPGWRRFLARFVCSGAVLCLASLGGVSSQIYGSAKEVLGQINSNNYPEFSDLTNYPYYLPESAVIGYSSPSLKESLHQVEEYSSRRDLDASHYVEFQRRREEFSEIERSRRKNQEAYKEFIRPHKRGSGHKDNTNRVVVKKMLAEERASSNVTRADVSHELVRKIESPFEAERMGIHPAVEELDHLDRKVHKYYLRSNNGKRIHYGASDSNHLAYFYDVNANCYWLRSSTYFECLTYGKFWTETEEIYSKTRVDPTLNVAFDSSSYQRLPQEYGQDRECVATYKDPISRRRVCIREGEYFDNLKKGPHRNGYIVWHPERSKHSVEADIFSEKYFQS